MKDIVLFLNNELNQTIDSISELKSLIQKTQIDIDTSVSFSQNIKSDKDDTAEFFVSESEDDLFDNQVIDDLNTKIDKLSKKLHDYELNLVKENEKLADIRELLNEYTVSEKEFGLDYSVNNDSNINKLIKCADSLYEDVCNFISDKLQYQVNFLIEKNKFITSLVNSDPQRSILELETTTNFLSAISNSIFKFSEKLVRYNDKYTFEENFNFLCRKYNGESLHFNFSFADEYNVIQNVDANKCVTYFKMLVNMLEYINNVSRETYKTDFINYKTKSKLIFTLAPELEFIQNDLNDEKIELRILIFYLNVSNSVIKFKKSKKNFVMEIDTNLY